MAGRRMYSWQHPRQIIKMEHGTHDFKQKTENSVSNEEKKETK